MIKMTGVWKEVDNIVKERYIPIHMMLEVTRRCNINCQHCYNIKDRAHFTFEQIDDIYAQLREAGCLFLTLTGGELFARTDAADILYRAREYGFDIRMITNGTMITKAMAQVLQDVAPTEVGVSVLGASAETHDAIARVPGAYKRMIQGIKNLKEAGVPVHIKCTLMQENIHELKDVVALAKELGVIYLIDPIVSPRDDGDTQNLKHRLSEGLIKDFYMKQFAHMTPDEDDEPPKEKGLPCEAGTAFGAISADGNVYPCIQMPKKVGNIFEQRFKDIWDNAVVLDRLRNVLPSEMNNCSSCSGSCSRCPGLAYLETGDMFGPSSVACYIGNLHKEYQAGQDGVEAGSGCCGSSSEKTGGCACAH